MIAMQLKFYLYTGDSKKMGKSLGREVFNCSGKLKEGCSIFNPTFVVKTNSNFLTKDKVNYITDDTFNRNYFIRDMVTNTDGTTSVICVEDVLTSFGDKLNNIKVIAERYEAANSPYLPDNMVPMNVNPNTSVYEFASDASEGFSNSDIYFIVQCAGPDGGLASNVGT